jgi:hypothetical protein
MNNTFNISLGNCGTSKLFSVTLDNDCIVIPGTRKRKVVLKFLKNHVEVRFFNKEGNTYYKKFNLGNTDDENTRSLLNVAAFLFYESTVPNYDINVDAELRSSVYTPNHLQKLGYTTINLFYSIIQFMNSKAYDEYTQKFRANVDDQLLGKNINLFNTTHNIPTNVAAVNTLPLSSSSSSEDDPPKVTAQPESSNVMAVSPSYKEGETDKYVTLFHPDGNRYFKKKPDGSYDVTNPLITRPEGGSHRRYRTTRRSRKYLSRRKSRRHIQRRKRTHRRKSRKSRK